MNPDAIPKAVLFDVFGTVVDWRGSLIEGLAAWAATRGVVADWAGLADAWRGQYAPSMDAVRLGRRPWTVLDELHRDSLQSLLPRFGLDGLDPQDIAHLAGLWRRMRPWPDAVAGLTRLRRHCVVAALSNGNVALLVAMARNAGLPWDMVFGADLFRHYKPDPETYLGACALLRLEPGEVMLAAAHASDLAAARACGMRTAFISRPLEHGPDGTAEPGGDWDFIAADIGHLAARLS